MTIDFVVGLRWFFRGNDYIRVIVDWLTKSTHFILIRCTISAKRLTRIYIQEIVWLLEVPILNIFIERWAPELI